MKDQMSKGLYNRLLVLNAGLLVVVLGMIFGLWMLDRTSEHQVLTQQLEEEQQTYKHIVDADGQSIESFARDYSFWDDMVSFVSSHDQSFAKENIDTGLTTYKADTAAVYNLNKKLVYQSNADKEVAFDLPNEFFDKLNKDRFEHFFIKDGSKLVEVRAATIHPSDDSAHAGAPKGYWVVGRLWDEGYLQHLGDLTQSRLALSDSGQTDTKITSSDLVFNAVVTDWRGNAVGAVAVTHPQQLSGHLQTALWHDVILIGVLAVLLLAALYFFHQRYILQPIEQIADSLRNGDSEPIEDLAKDPSEFGYLARAVLELDKQKAAAKAAEERNKELKRRVADYEDIKKELSDNRNRVAKILEGVLKRGDKGKN